MIAGVTMFLVVITGLLVEAGAGSTAEARIELARSGEAQAVIVVDDSASQREEAAIGDLKKYLGQVTGAEFETAGLENAPPGMPRIFVGHSPAVRRLAPNIPWESLGTDEIVIRTVGRDLVLSGGRPRGTVYAIYTFLQDAVGCRWWTRGAESIPGRPNLTVPPLDIRYRPPFEMRVIRGEVGSWPESQQWLRLTFDENFDPATHSVDQLLPKSNFVKHPDWFMVAKEDGDAEDEHSFLYALNQMKAAGREAEYEVAKRTRRLPLQPCLHSRGACRTITDGARLSGLPETATCSGPTALTALTSASVAIFSASAGVNQAVNPLILFSGSLSAGP